MATTALKNTRFKIQLIPSPETEKEMARLLDEAGGSGPASPAAAVTMTISEAYQYFKGLKEAEESGH